MGMDKDEIARYVHKKTGEYQYLLNGMLGETACVSQSQIDATFDDASLGQHEPPTTLELATFINSSRLECKDCLNMGCKRRSAEATEVPQEKLSA